jgi:hypothetical protein
MSATLKKFGVSDSGSWRPGFVPFARAAAMPSFVRLEISRRSINDSWNLLWDIRSAGSRL